jgi:2-methylisocitrate lyase-like PEP mutase family enzyme
VDAREEGADILVMGRTDSNATDGLDDAIERCKAYIDAGADITFLEAPVTIQEMERYCNEVPGHKMANMVENGATPVLSPQQLQDIGYSIALYPVTTLRASIMAQQAALAEFAKGKLPDEGGMVTFDELQDVVGFKQYFKDEVRYSE